jgi:ferritin
MAVAEQLKDSIDHYTAELGKHTPVYDIARAGKLTARAMALYLESLRYLFENTERHLTVAAIRCEQAKRTKLAAYFRRKAKEENGHARWPISDLAQLPRHAVEGVRPAPAVVELVALQARFIEQEPLCFVAYLQWAEYFSVSVGDLWLDALAMSGFPRAQVTAIFNHLETDRLHAAAGFREIDELLENRIEPSLLMAAVEESGRTFTRLCNQIAATATTRADPCV